MTGAEALAMSQAAILYTVGGYLGACAFVAIGWALISRRWGWYPRKRQRVMFVERMVKR